MKQASSAAAAVLPLLQRVAHACARGDAPGRYEGRRRSASVGQLAHVQELSMEHRERDVAVPCEGVCVLGGAAGRACIGLLRARRGGERGLTSASTDACDSPPLLPTRRARVWCVSGQDGVRCGPRDGTGRPGSLYALASPPYLPISLLRVCTWCCCMGAPGVCAATAVPPRPVTCDLRRARKDQAVTSCTEDRCPRPQEPPIKVSGTLTSRPHQRQQRKSEVTAAPHRKRTARRSPTTTGTRTASAATPRTLPQHHVPRARKPGPQRSSPHPRCACAPSKGHEHQRRRLRARCRSLRTAAATPALGGHTSTCPVTAPLTLPNTRHTQHRAAGCTCAAARAYRHNAHKPTLRAPLDHPQRQSGQRMLKAAACATLQRGCSATAPPHGAPNPPKHHHTQGDGSGPQAACALQLLPALRQRHVAAGVQRHRLWLRRV